jgi:hypothetical protein
VAAGLGQQSGRLALGECLVYPMPGSSVSASPSEVGGIMKLRLLLMPTVAGCAVLGSAAPASADPPERFSETSSFSEPGFVQCDGFEIDLAGTETRDFTTFFDENGQVVKIIIHSHVTETSTNSVTGKTLVNRGVFTDFVTRIDGTDEFTHTVSGFDFQGKVDGRGPLVFQDVGRKVFVTDPATGEETVLFRTGHSTLPEGPEAEAVFCAALT